MTDTAPVATEPKDYAINVRAIVHATPGSDDAACTVAGWDVYDRDSGEDGQIVLRCDQLVNVKATNDEQAIEFAKADASPILVDGCVVDGVDLWVDEGIDVNPDQGSLPTP